MLAPSSMMKRLRYGNHSHAVNIIRVRVAITDATLRLLRKLRISERDIYCTFGVFAREYVMVYIVFFHNPKWFLCCARSEEFKMITPILLGTQMSWCALNGLGCLLVQATPPMGLRVRDV